MKEYLIFRTDRVGDFLLTLSLIKIIKINHPESKITIIASEKNFDYIKTFKVVNNVIKLKNNFFSKISLILNLRKKIFDSIIVHDGKKRSKFISFFLNYNNRVICITNLIDTQLDIIKKTCKNINLNFTSECLNFMDERKYNSSNIPFKNYIHLHFDEKWCHDMYIKNYTNIEPNKDELLKFIENIVSKKKYLVITTGKKIPEKLIEIQDKLNTKKVKIFYNQELYEIENIVFNSDLLITCHGWISHIASSKSIKQIDIIDDQYPYNKWTSHFRNYNFVNRTSFNNLSKEILDLI